MKLCLTYCGAKKRDGVLPPGELYLSSRIGRFVKYCKDKNLNWAILSAKYGLFFPEEKRGKYNVTFCWNSGCWSETQVKENEEKLPRNQSDITLKQLAKTMATQIDEHCVERIVYYYENKEPMKPPKGYLALLHFVFNSCEKPHTWLDLLDCIKKHGRIETTVQLAFDP